VFSASNVYSFLRRFLIACVVVAVVAAVGVNAGDSYGKQKFEGADKVHLDENVLTNVDPGEPANFLLIGSDKRSANPTPEEEKAFGSTADTGDARADVMMVLHVDPAQKRGMLVSFPRDLLVDVPGYGTEQLNATYVLGGPSLVIQTLEQNFEPMKINHYIEVDFESFRKIADAVGKINVWFPTPVHDEWTGLHQEQAGCAQLNGDQALAYARSRHYSIPEDLESPAPWVPQGDGKRSDGWIEDPRADLDRIPRQQYFLRTIGQAAVDKIGKDPLSFSRLLDAVFENFTTDDKLKYGEFKKLAQTFKDLNPTKVDMMTIPWEAAGNGRVVAREPDASAVISRLANFDIPKNLPTPVNAGTVKVRVVNGSGIPGIAARVQNMFQQAGFETVGEPADAEQDDYDKTQVRYAPGKNSDGFTAAFAIGTPNFVEAASKKATLGGEVLVIVGKDYDSLLHRFNDVPGTAITATTLPGATPTSVAATTVPTTAAAPTTTSTTLPAEKFDERFVPVDPTTGGPLVGCPT
jgi:LCP family protein required for cell wall assembly